jgi:hypothetical protein
MMGPVRHLENRSGDNDSGSTVYDFGAKWEEQGLIDEIGQ